MVQTWNFGEGAVLVAEPMFTPKGHGHLNHQHRSDSRDRGRAHAAASVQRYGNGPLPSENWDVDDSIARTRKLFEELYPGEEWDDDNG